MQVSIPNLENFSVDEWNTSDEVPIVAIVPQSIENDVIPAWDADGNYHELSASEAPDRSVIVISENERTIAIPKGSGTSSGRLASNNCPILADAITSTDQFDIYHTSDYYDSHNLCTISGGGGGNPTPTPPPSPSCDRDRKSGKDILHRMKFESMARFRQANEWFENGQDIEVTIVFARANGAVSQLVKTFHGNDHEFKNCGIFNSNPKWFEMNAEIVTWNPETYGDAMWYSFVEKDPEDPCTITSVFTTNFTDPAGNTSSQQVQISQTISDEDEVLGQSIVEYCDNTDGDGYTYKPGWVYFQVRQ